MKIIVCDNCKNKIKLKRTIIQHSDGTYTFGYNDFRFCPCCGALMPKYKEKLRLFFELYDLHPDLERAKSLLLKSEFEAAIREAAVTLENSIKEKSGLNNLHGKDLASKALRMEYDKATEKIKTPPLIAINGLKTESDRNEQEGFMMMLMGFFQGIRNLVQHNHIPAGVNMQVTQIFEVSYFLYLLEGEHSILKPAHWVRGSTRWIDIYKNMPRLIDRVYLRISLRVKWFLRKFQK